MGIFPDGLFSVHPKTQGTPTIFYIIYLSLILILQKNLDAVIENRRAFLSAFLVKLKLNHGNRLLQLVASPSINTLLLLLLHPAISMDSKIKSLRKWDFFER